MSARLVSRAAARRYITACIAAHATHHTRVGSDVYDWLEAQVRQQVDQLVFSQRRFKSLRAPRLSPEQRAACRPRALKK